MMNCRSLLAPIIGGALLIMSFSAHAALEQRVLSLEILESPSSRYGSTAWAVSDDGSVVVGAGNGGAYIWQSGILTVTLPGEARGVSGDGKVVVGQEYSGTFSTHAFRWENGTASTIMGLPETTSIEPYGISADGNVIVGASNWRPDGVSRARAFRSENGVAADLGYLDEGDIGIEARDVSADGSVVVGVAETPLIYNAFRWENGQMIDLGPGSARGVSADGTTVVGSSTNSNASFLWRSGKRIELLGTRAEKVSGDGSIVIGWMGGSHEKNESIAAIWAFSTGYAVNNLDDMADQSGIDRQGFSMIAAYDINPEGTIIVGKGFYPEVDRLETYAFKMILTEPVRNWGVFPLEGGYANTGGWLGYLWPETEEWAWCLNLGSWIHVPVFSREAGQGWVYIPK